MKKISLLLGGVILFANSALVFAAEKFEILPDLPEPLAAQASTVSTVDSALHTTNSVGAEPNLVSVVFSLLFVILLIYATGIIYTKLNKLGFNTMKKQMGDVNSSKVSVVSTTPLGSNKTLHVVELDGKRMLIGASSNSIHLIKDLGTFPPKDIDKLEYSNIEIPNIRIPKIEIPKIEFPNIGFTRVAENEFEDILNQEGDNIESKPYENKESQEDNIIGDLFNEEIKEEDNQTETLCSEHSVDPDEYALYKKYL